MDENKKSAVGGDMLGETLGRIFADPELMKKITAVASSMKEQKEPESKEDTYAGENNEENPVDKEMEKSDRHTNTDDNADKGTNDKNDKNTGLSGMGDIASIIGKLPELSGVLQPLLPILGGGNIGRGKSVDAAERKRQSDRRCALLAALKPYLASEAKRGAVDVIVSVSKISGLLG